MNSHPYLMSSCAHSFRSFHYLQTTVQVGRRAQDIQGKKVGSEGRWCPTGIIIIPISASSSSQSIALLIQASSPAWTDPIPTRSVSESSARRRETERRRGYSITYASVGFFTDKLVLELCVWRQVHRCAPHGVIGRIQRDL